MNFISRLRSLFVLTIGIFLLTSLFSTVRAQQTHNPKFSTTVRVGVSEGSERHLITSYIGRELRSLGDVRIVEEHAEWELKILPMVGAHKKIVILTVVILKPFDIRDRITFDILPEEYKDICIEATSNLHYFLDLRMWTGTYEELRSICEDIITYFDSKYLEQSRKFYEE